MIRSTIFAAAVLAVSALGAPAFANDLPTVEVRYADLNLNSADGAKALQVRVKRAADRVCGARGLTELRSRMEASACTKTALAKAMPQVELALANAKDTQLAENSRVSVSAH